MKKAWIVFRKEWFELVKNKLILYFYITNFHYLTEFIVI